MQIAFFDTKPYDKEFFDKANRSHNFSIHYLESRLTEETASLAKGYEVVCIFVSDVVNQKVIDILVSGGTKLIALRCAGFNNIDLEAATGRLKIVRVPYYSPYAVAEHAVGMMMTLNRKLHRAYTRTHDNNFSIAGLLGFDMHGKTAGVIGCGKIGSVMVKILQGFGMRVLGFDTSEELVTASGAQSASLETIYAESDIITLHCPLTPATHRMINHETIAKMKKGVMLINTGRGGLIDTKSLIAGLKSEKIGSAGLDVYEEENDFFYEDFSSGFIPDDTLARLLTLPNVLITSHQAFFTEEAMSNISMTTLDNIEAYKEGTILPNVVMNLPSACKN